MKYIPTLFGVSDLEIEHQYELVNEHFNHFHIDIISSTYVYDDFFPNSIFNLLIKDNKTCEVHIMSSLIDKTLKTLSNFDDCITEVFIHFEVFQSIEDIEELITNWKYEFKPSLVIDIDTQVEDIIQIISYFKTIMVMGVKAGAQGQEFVQSQINKIRVLKKLGCRVSIDGGINKNSIIIIPQNIDQVNVGSFFNQKKSSKEVLQALQELQFKTPISKKPIIIADIGGTYIKVFRGFIQDFSTKDVEIKALKDFKNQEEIIEFILSKVKAKKVILSIAGQKIAKDNENSIEHSIIMTHQNFNFNQEELIKKYKIHFEIYNDCELAGYAISKDTQKELFLELLIMIGTGVGVSHISNSGIVYNSEGGQIYAHDTDHDYFSFLKNKIGEDQLKFDHILSASGLELRAFYDLDKHYNSIEIMDLAFKKDIIVYKTILFFLEELYLFLNNCIAFDNVISKIYVGGTFLQELLDLMKIYLPDKYSKLNSKCEFEYVDDHLLPIIGGINKIYNE